jgi:small subunit ribosomal protein S16
VAVRLRMKRMGRTHRPFYRICAMDGRAPRDGRVIEELGHYDPMCKETDARAILKSQRIDYWLSVGAQPSDNVRVLIKKYGTDGTHLEQQREALGRLERRPEAPPPVAIRLPQEEAPPAAETATAEKVSAETATAETAAAETASATPTAKEKDSAAKPSSAEPSSAKETAEAPAAKVSPTEAKKPAKGETSN